MAYDLAFQGRLSARSGAAQIANWPDLPSGVNFLLRGAVELAGDLRDERRAVLGLSQAVNQNDQHKRPRRKNDPGIVVNPVISPVVCATRVPAGSPAGMPSLKL